MDRNDFVEEDVDGGRADLKVVPADGQQNLVLTQTGRECLEVLGRVLEWVRLGRIVGVGLVLLSNKRRRFSLLAGMAAVDDSASIHATLEMCLRQLNGEYSPSVEMLDRIEKELGLSAAQRARLEVVTQPRRASAGTEGIRF